MPWGMSTPATLAQGVDMGAFIPALATFGGAALNAEGGKGAADAQERTASWALDFAKKQEMARRQRYTDAMRAWNAGRKQLAAMWGLTIPDEAFNVSDPGSMTSPVPGGHPYPGGMPPGGVPGGVPGAPPGAVPGAVPRPNNVAGLMGY